MTPARWIDPFARADGPPPGRLWPFLRWATSGGGGTIVWGGLISAFAGLLEVATAIMLGWVIDGALASTPGDYWSDNRWLLIGVAVFYVAFRPAIMGLSALMQSVVIGPALGNLILSRLHRHALGQSVRFFDDDFAGRIAQKQMQAARATTDLVIDAIHTVSFALASLLGSVVLMLTIDLRTAAALALWTAAYIWVLRAFLPRIRARSKARAAKRAMVTGQVVDTITNIRTVKLFAHDDHEDRAAIEAMDSYWDVAVTYGWLSTAFRFWLMALGGLLPLILVGMTLWFWTQGAASAGDIAAAGAIALRLSQMTGWVSFTLMGMYSNLGEVEDAVRTLSPAHELTDAEDAPALAEGPGAVAFEGVRFRYGGGPGGIEGLTLRVAPGEKLGVVGASGAGKSTLVALLLRLYDTEDGRVLVDGQDVREVTQDSLRGRIAMVTQDTAMFNRSARDNIRYGRPEATQEEIEAAAKKAEAHDFIVTLRDHAGRRGYDAHLGERGVKLSGGQRQRIAIARAVLKDAPILVLDEATSALDSEVEAAIQTALEHIMEGKTVIAVAHRLSTLAHMDRIVVLDEGRLVEEGTHEALLAQGGLYARYWSRQSGGFIGAEGQAAE